MFPVHPLYRFSRKKEKKRRKTKEKECRQHKYCAYQKTWRDNRSDNSNGNNNEKKKSPGYFLLWIMPF
jgi:hypothetical protein